MCVLGLGLQMLGALATWHYKIPHGPIYILALCIFLFSSHGVSFVLVEPFVHVANLLLSFGVVPLSFVSEISSWCSCSCSFSFSSLEVISNFVIIIP